MVMGRPLYFTAVVSSSFFFFLFSSPVLSGRRVDVYHTSTVHTWCGLSANLECRFEMYCTWLAEIQDAKTRQRIAIAQLCRAISSQLTHVSTRQSEKKLVKQQYPLQMSSQYGELRPTNV